MLAYIVQIDGYDPVTASPVVLRAASHDDERICHIDGGTWWPAIAQLPTLSQSNFDGSFGGQISAPSSSMRLQAEPWPLLGRYALADARIRIWAGTLASPWASWEQRCDGRLTAQPAIADGTAQIAFAVDDRWLDTPLLTSYAGTGGAEGPEALKGSVKPLMLGFPRYATGELIDSVNTVIQLSAYGPIEDVDAALDGLARFAAPIGNYASYDALIAASIPAGAWATAKAVGMTRHGAPPFEQITYMVSGDKAGPDGWARRPGDLIRRIAQLTGTVGRVYDDSLDALNTARPWNLSIAVTDQTTARDLIQRIAASVNAVAGVNWLGQLYAVPVEIGAATLTLSADGSTLPPIQSIEQMDASAPWWRLSIEAERSWTVHAQEAVQFLEPAEPGATNGAPAGSQIAGRNAEDVIADLNFNADTSMEALLTTQGFQAVVDARTFIAGQPISTVVVNEINERIEDQQAIASDLSLLGAKSPDGNSWVLNVDGVISGIDPASGLPQSLGTALTQIGAVNGEHSAQIDQLMETVVTPDGSSAKAILRVNADGSIAGILLTSDGTESAIEFVADTFRIVDPNGGAPFTPFEYGDGQLKLTNVLVDTLTYGALVPLLGGTQNQLSPTAGYQIFPGGFMMQWGKVRKTINDEQVESITFPIAFPTGVMSLTATPFISAFSVFRDLWLQNVGEPSKTGASFATQSSTSNSQHIDGFDWMAFGY